MKLILFGKQLPITLEYHDGRWDAITEIEGVKVINYGSTKGRAKTALREKLVSLGVPVRTVLEYPYKPYKKDVQRGSNGVRSKRRLMPRKK